MIAPEKINSEAKKKQKENLAFRSFLKFNADEDTLDEQFAGWGNANLKAVKHFRILTSRNGLTVFTVYWM